MNSIGALLADARHRLPGPDALLEAELLLAHVASTNRAHLKTYPERELPPEQAERYRQLVERRTAGEPIAYIIGETGFWSLQLYCGPSTLIPRPETELLVETALQLDLPESARVLDLGTGTGAIALALAVERPRWQITAVDSNPDSLLLAERNRERVRADNVRLMQSNWFDALDSSDRFDLVLSNPPYIAANDPHLERGDLRFEPRSALESGVDGLRDIEAIATGALTRCPRDGWLLLEHGYDQGEAVRALLTQLDYRSIVRRDDLSGHWRVSGGMIP